MSKLDRGGDAMTIIAHLDTPPILSGPVLFDGLLVGARGAQMGAEDPSGLKDSEEVHRARMPLSRVRSKGGKRWWYAASQVTPLGLERSSHTHRRPPAEQYSRLTSERTLNLGTGPDKALRVKHYYRPMMMRFMWTAVGDIEGVCELLGYINSIGKLTTHGHGWVRSWEVISGGPELARYSYDIRLRHIPTSQIRQPGNMDGVRVSMLPVHPPYHRRNRAEPCWQIVS